MLPKNIHNWLIFKHPFWVALTISLLYVGIGILIARSDIHSGLASFLSLTTAMPLVAFFGINSSPSVLEQIAGGVILALLYSAVLTAIFVLLKKLFAKT